MLKSIVVTPLSEFDELVFQTVVPQGHYLVEMSMSLCLRFPITHRTISLPGILDEGLVQSQVTNRAARRPKLRFSELSVSPKLVVLTSPVFQGGNRRVSFYSRRSCLAAGHSP